ncbi:MAG: hypothetical protein OEY59_10610 [Deltaproteobacteria bacterium]|nr:hypothetical protein [Deltaproteobacteria bacterium]
MSGRDKLDLLLDELCGREEELMNDPVKYKDPKQWSEVKAMQQKVVDCYHDFKDNQTNPNKTRIDSLHREIQELLQQLINTDGWGEQDPIRKKISTRRVELKTLLQDA